MDLLDKRAYAGLRVAEVARRAGVSNGALSHYFKSKDELLLAAAANAFDEELAKELARVAEATRDTDPVRALVEGQKNFHYSRFSMLAWELSIAARDNKVLAKKMRVMRDAFRARRREAWCDLLVAGGIMREVAEAMVRITGAFWRGIAMDFLADRPLPPSVMVESANAAKLLQTMFGTLR
jgi:AcrR family transcriptional regulator